MWCRNFLPQGAETLTKKLARWTQRLLSRDTSSGRRPHRHILRLRSFLTFFAPTPHNTQTSDRWNTRSFKRQLPVVRPPVVRPPVVHPASTFRLPLSYHPQTDGILLSSRRPSFRQPLPTTSFSSRKFFLFVARCPSPSLRSPHNILYMHSNQPSSSFPPPPPSPPQHPSLPPGCRCAIREPDEKMITDGQFKALEG